MRRLKSDCASMGVVMRQLQPFAGGGDAFPESKMGIELRCVGRAGRMMFCLQSETNSKQREALITDWMREHAYPLGM